MAKCRNLNVLTVEARWAFKDILDRIEFDTRPYAIHLDGGPPMTARAAGAAPDNRTRGRVG